VGCRVGVGFVGEIFPHGPWTLFPAIVQSSGYKDASRVALVAFSSVPRAQMDLQLAVVASAEDPELVSGW